MALRTLVKANVAGIVERQIEVLEHLRKPETLHIVDKPAAVGRIHVVDWRICDGVCLEVRLEALVCGDGAVVVRSVARVAPRVKVGLEHLGAHVVVRGRDEEAVLVVEGALGGGRGRAGVVAVAREVAERLRADASAACPRREIANTERGKGETYAVLA